MPKQPVTFVIHSREPRPGLMGEMYARLYKERFCTPEQNFLVEAHEDAIEQEKKKNKPES